MKIGRFTIHESHNRPRTIWIGLDDGEGGEFDELELEKIILKFYEEKF